MLMITNTCEVQDRDYEYVVSILDECGWGTKKRYIARSEPEAIEKALAAFNSSYPAARVTVTFSRPA